MTYSSMELSQRRDGIYNLSCLKTEEGPEFKASLGDIASLRLVWEKEGREGGRREVWGKESNVKIARSFVLL